MITTNIEQMEFSPATNEEVRKEISALKKNGNSVHDIPKIFLRNCSEFVSPGVVQFIQQLFAEGKISGNLQDSEVHTSA